MKPKGFFGKNGRDNRFSITNYLKYRRKKESYRAFKIRISENSLPVYKKAKCARAFFRKLKRDYIQRVRFQRLRGKQDYGRPYAGFPIRFNSLNKNQRRNVRNKLHNRTKSVWRPKSCARMEASA